MSDTLPRNFLDHAHTPGNEVEASKLVGIIGDL